jgi:PTH1 family peptidyl-tRNA hydrolase
MILIVGLGNPGKKYEKTRHNVGFIIMDQLKLLNLKGVILFKPKTFMNESGKAVKKLLKIYRIKTKNLIIIHDDLDLPLGKIKISVNRGAAGHKGVESIIKELRTKNFVRFRIGINRFAQNQKLKIKNQKLFVLKNFTKNEEKIIKEIIRKTTRAIKFTIKEGVEKAMNKYN